MPTTVMHQSSEPRRTVRKIFSHRLARFATPLLLLGVVLIAAGVATHASAQQASGAADEGQQRERMYRELADDVAGLEKQLSVLKRVSKLAHPTVVHIEATKREEDRVSFGSEATIEEAGSGVIVSLDGKTYVLTNRHVVKNAYPRDIVIKLSDEREIKPRKLWADKDTDIAVLSVDDESLVPARLGDSNGVEIGDFVLAFGSPFGLSQSVTYGIVSAKGRTDLELGDNRDKVKIQNFIQTDAAINPGNSGGPLINLRGEVVGINTAIASSSGGNEGIGFSIPINMVKTIARLMTTSKKKRHGFLGVVLDSKFNADQVHKIGFTAGTGARIKGVEKSTAAAAADLRAGDVIVEFQGTKVENDSHLIRLIGLTESDQTVTLRILRDGESFMTSVRLRGGETEFEIRE